MWTIFLAVLLTAIGLSKSLPAPGNSLHYEIGTSYKYSYQFTILLNEDSNITSRSASLGRNVGYRVSSEFLLSPIWQSPDKPQEKLLKLELLKPTLHVSSTMHSNEGENKHWSKLDNLSYPPIYIHWNDGLVKKIYVLPDSPSMINIKKGLASLLQLRVADSPVKELDVSGMCDVLYKVHGFTIKKNKSNCERSTFPLKNNINNKLLKPIISSTSEMVINLVPQKSIIQSVSGREEVMMTLTMWKQAAVFVKNKFHIKYIEQSSGHPVFKGKSVSDVIAEVSKEMRTKISSEPLEVTTEAVPCLTKCKPVNELVGEYGVNLLPEHIGQLKSAAGFLKFLDSFRKASKKELLMLFKDTDSRILTQLLDVLAAAQTDDALEVAFQLIDFESKEIDLAERFLLCLAVVPNPNEALISKTLKLLNKNIKTEKLRSTILITLSSMVRSFCKNNPSNVNSLAVQTIGDLLLRNLQGCQDIGCTISYLLAIRNSALPRYLPVLVEYAKHGGILGLMSLEAMKDIGEKHFTPEINNILLKIYNQFWPHQESASRVLAAELLMRSSPNVETLGNMLLSLTDPAESEVNSMLFSKIKNLMQEKTEIRHIMKEILRNVTYGNYHNLAQNGTSSSIFNLLQATQDANATYGINIEMRSTGMLKRTNFDLNLRNNDDKLHLMSLGLFVEGFGLTDEEQKENPEEHSAGMQLSILGVHLRPYIFFSGTTELMGLVWSGVGNEPTPAVQANLLLMDETHTVVLQNGITVDLNLKGALSVGVYGTVEVSMWNKNAHATVKNKGALLINGFCKVDTSFVESHVDFALGGNSELDMQVNLDFGKKPMKICLQLEQPEYLFRHNVRKTETIPGSKYLLKTIKRRNMYFPGKSFNLHQKNSDFCRDLLIPKKQKSSFW